MEVSYYPMMIPSRLKDKVMNGDLGMILYAKTVEMHITQLG